MPKYMKDARFKKPRDKNYEEKEPKFHHKKLKETKSKSDHKHIYEECVIVEKSGHYNFITLGKRCKFCNRLVKGRFLLTNEIPEEYKDLPIITMEGK